MLQEAKNSSDNMPNINLTRSDPLKSNISTNDSLGLVVEYFDPRLAA